MLQLEHKLFMHDIFPYEKYHMTWGINGLKTPGTGITLAYQDELPQECENSSCSNNSGRAQQLQ